MTYLPPSTDCNCYLVLMYTWVGQNNMKILFKMCHTSTPKRILPRDISICYLVVGKRSYISQFFVVKVIGQNSIPSKLRHVRRPENDKY